MKHDRSYHGDHDEAHPAGDALNASEHAVRRGKEDAQPKMLVSDYLCRLHLESVRQVASVAHVKGTSNTPQPPLGRQPVVAHEVPHLVRLNVAHRYLVEIPGNYDRVKQ